MPFRSPSFARAGTVEPADRLGHDRRIAVGLDQQHVADSIRVAPPHQPPAAESAIGPDRDPDLAPSGAERLDQELQQGTGVLGRVDVAGAKVGCEQFVAAEDVEW